MVRKNDQEIKQTFQAIFEQKRWEVPVITHNELSPDFREKLDYKLARSFYLFNRPVSKLAVLITVIFLTIVLAACAFFINDIFVHRGVKNSDIGLNNESRSDVIQSIYSTQGTILNRLEEDTWVQTEYDRFILTQYVGSTSINIDNEGTNEEICWIHDTQGVVSEKNGDITIIWGEYGYIFELFSPGEASADELIEIAESLLPE